MPNESSSVRPPAVENARSGELIGQISPPRFSVFRRLRDLLIPQLRDHPKRSGILAGVFLGTSGVLIGSRILMMSGLTLFIGGFAADRFRNGPRK